LGCECSTFADFDLNFKEIELSAGGSWLYKNSGYLGNMSGECYDVSGLCKCYVSYNFILQYDKQSEKLTSNISSTQTLIFSNKN
jgi:hypothetical protein